VAQETLLQVFESFSDLREPERVRPWVFRIAKNACLMKRRKSIFAPDRELSLDDCGGSREIGGSIELLRDLEELSTEETAQILGLTRDVVIEHQLAGCSPCEEFAESLRRTVELCRQFEPRALPGPIGLEARTALEEAWKKMLQARSASRATY
jgi:RNA polymerase sigma-70 factor (ECF subfamily)